MKGIMFQQSLFEAVIEGRKTQTRRIMKPQPRDFIGITPYGFDRKGDGCDYYSAIKPRYSVGEVLYLKEPYYVEIKETKETPPLIYYKYRAKDIDFLMKTGLINTLPVKWKNKLFMPAEYARYYIEITAVRCERVQDISDGDCEKEGVINDGFNEDVGQSFYCADGYGCPNYATQQQAYAALFNSINGKGSWERNDWVWVYDLILVNNK